MVACPPGFPACLQESLESTSPYGNFLVGFPTEIHRTSVRGGAIIRFTLTSVSRRVDTSQAALPAVLGRHATRAAVPPDPSRRATRREPA